MKFKFQIFKRHFYLTDKNEHSTIYIAIGENIQVQYAK